MKTRFGILIVLLVLLSVFAAAEQGAGNDVSGSDDDSTTIEVEQLPEDIASSAVESPRCAEFLKGKFPRVNSDKLETICQRLKAKVNSDELKTMVKERVESMRKLSEEKKAALGELNQERKAFMEKFRDEELGKLNGLAKEEFKKAASLSRAQLKGCVQGNETAAKECVGKYQIEKFTNKAELFRQRTVQNFEAAKKRFEELKGRYTEIKDDLKAERTAWQESIKSGTEEEQVEAGKKYFDKTADLIINNLEQIKSKVEENDDLSEEEAAEIIADIDARIAEIQEAKEDVDDATTKEELKAAASEIVQRWKNMQHKIMLHLEYLGRAKVMDVMKRSEYMERKIENAIVKLEEKGYDTADLDALVTQFSEKIDSAREDFKSGNQLLIKAKNMTRTNATKEEAQAIMQEGKALIKGAHDKLVEAHEMSKTILAKIRELAGNIDSVTEESGDDYVSVVEDDYDNGNDNDSDDGAESDAEDGEDDSGDSDQNETEDEE